MPNLLLEFEKRYKGDPSQTTNICREIASKFNMDAEEVADFIYINRYSEIENEDLDTELIMIKDGIDNE
jgi:hypothetical protein